MTAGSVHQYIVNMAYKWHLLGRFYTKTYESVSSIMRNAKIGRQHLQINVVSESCYWAYLTGRSCTQFFVRSTFFVKRVKKTASH